jgi:hypothetical protein
MGDARINRRVWATATALGILAAAGASPLAGATMPPKVCGPMTVGKTRYLVKADQVPCPFAKTWARRYIVARRHPAGFTCARTVPSSRIKVYCRRSYHTYFALK